MRWNKRVYVYFVIGALLPPLLIGCTRADVAKWLEVSATNGDPNAQIQLGKMYLEGDGVPRNQVIGEMWLRRAAQQSSAPVRQTLDTNPGYGGAASQSDQRCVKWMWINGQRNPIWMHGRDCDKEY